MKRRAFKVMVFVILGAIINVAVAWGCAIRYSRYVVAPDFAGGTQVPRGGWSTKTYNEVSTDAWQVLEAHGWRANPQTVRVEMCIAEWKGITEQIWYHVVGSDFGYGFNPIGCRLSAGWPLRGVSGERWTPKYPDTSSQMILGGVPSEQFTTRWLGLTDGFGFFFPFLPTWPGFAINTIFYAAVLWLLLAAPFAYRRHCRIKRGLCPACAYPVGTSEVCTECGKLVTCRYSRCVIKELIMSGSLAVVVYRCIISDESLKSLDVQVRWFDSTNRDEIRASLIAEPFHHYLNSEKETVTWELVEIMAIEPFEPKESGEEVVGFIASADALSKMA